LQQNEIQPGGISILTSSSVPMALASRPSTSSLIFAVGCFERIVTVKKTVNAVA
jgi:hypothetical protein